MKGNSLLLQRLHQLEKPTQGFKLVADVPQLLNMQLCVLLAALHLLGLRSPKQMEDSLQLLLGDDAGDVIDSLLVHLQGGPSMDARLAADV